MREAVLLMFYKH